MNIDIDEYIGLMGETPGAYYVAHSPLTPVPLEKEARVAPAGAHSTPASTCSRSCHVDVGAAA